MDAPTDTDAPSCSVSWKEGSSGILAGVLAALCCVAPPVLGVLGLSGLASFLGAMPFPNHVILQCIALGIILLTWSWFGWKWTKMSTEIRRSPWTIITGLILIGVSGYVPKTWYVHIFLMG